MLYAVSLLACMNILPYMCFLIFSLTMNASLLVRLRVQNGLVGCDGLECGYLGV